MPIHPTAIVDKSAEIDPTAEIGAYAIIEPNVTIGPEAQIYPHAYVSSGTTLAARVQIHPFAVVGHHPQDFAWNHSPSYTHVGEETVIREHASIHRGTIPESTTIVGKRVFLMSTGHIGHNCNVGDRVILTNGALLAGHVHVGHGSIVGGGAGVHQFCRVGELSIISGLTRVNRDIPPFMIAAPQGIVGPNVIGLRRAGLDSAERQELRRAYHVLFRSGLLFREAIAKAAEMVQTVPGRRLVEFLQAPSKRGVTGYQRKGKHVRRDTMD